MNLGTATEFAALAGSAITNSPLSVINGDVGLSSAATTAMTRLTCAETPACWGPPRPT